MRPVNPSRTFSFSQRKLRCVAAVDNMFSLRQRIPLSHLLLTCVQELQKLVIKSCSSKCSQGTGVVLRFSTEKASDMRCGFMLNRTIKSDPIATILLPLSCPDSDFTGGGTAFWSQDSRGHRVEDPSLVLIPPAGTAMIFGGCGLFFCG